MCGIFGVINDTSHQAAQTVLSGLKKLEYRGYDSWGIAVKPLDKQKLIIEKHIGKIGDATTTLPMGTIAVGHTRWATHGGVTDANAHPHLDCMGTIAVIHNGIVENYHELKEQLKKQKHRFVSETDTEVIAHMIEEKRRTLPLHDAVFDTFKNLVGSNAIAVLDAQSRSIIVCRDGSPLALGFGKGQYFVASDVTPFLKFTNQVYFLNDGEGATLTLKGIEIYDLNKKIKIKPRILTLDWKIEDAEKGGYPHFLLKEIYEQRITVGKTAKINEFEIQQIATLIKNADKVIFTGCGTAYHCALAGKYFFAQHLISSDAIGAYEFAEYKNLYGKKSVMIAISQSGETADTLIAVKEAKKNGVVIVAIINARGSTLERIADYVLPVGAGPEIAVLSTKAYTSQLAILYLLSYATAGKYAVASKNILTLDIKLKKWLNKNLNNQILSLSKKLQEHTSIFLIGKHLNFPGALEAALKIKEASYIHSEAFASGELKHGVISLIYKEVPCIVLASNDNVKGEIISSATELKSRGGFIIGIAPFESKLFDDMIKTPDAGDLTIVGNVIVGQLLGYYLAIGRGADPDKPRNLAKSVTVK